ncbi:MAG: recombination mediator RecR [Verrucomicrobiota bacterium]
MARIEYPREVSQVIAAFRNLPGVGPKSAERMALWLLDSQRADVLEMTRAFSEAAEVIAICPRCGFFQGREECLNCSERPQESSTLCVVERASDVIAMERTGAFKGSYHCLGGKLSPLDHIGPEELRIPTLVERIREGGVSEVILATGSDVEGEATANYLFELLAPEPVTVTRLAQGMPAGGGLESADDLTLLRAFANRRSLERE